MARLEILISMKVFSLAGIALTLFALPAMAATKPNILLIYTDDHGWADVGAQGVNKEIRTPHMDQLIHEGVRFARGYVSAPQCVPSRAGVLTGRYQEKFGVEDNNHGPLPLEELTIAERLKPAGYVTGQVGKWHLDIGGEKGEARGLRVQLDHMPNAQGFDEYWRGEMKQFYASHDLQGRPIEGAPKLVADDRFRVVVQTEAALSFLERRSANKEQPWFLYLAWFAPHVPLESPEPWFSQTPKTLPLERRQALSMIAAMDDGLGRIRSKLKEMGVEKDTLIFLISDNGAPLKQGAWNGSLNAPLVGEKGMLTDGGIRTPFMAAWPGKLPAGTVYDKPVSSLDVASTAVALAGQPHDDKLDGVNLMPFVTGENKGSPHDVLYWRWRSQAAVLEFPWKLIKLGPEQRFLFDVTTPEGESVERDQLKQHPEIAARLESKLQTWSASLKPPGLPTEVVMPDAEFYADHDLMPLPKGMAPRGKAKAAARGPDPFQGWICRNGSLSVTEGALAVHPDKTAGPPAFITHNNLKLAGPVTATLHIRSSTAGKGSFAWRLDGQKDFVPGQSANFDLVASPEWQTVKVTLPSDQTLIHLRLHFPVGCQPAVEALELKDRDGKATAWKFDGIQK